MTGAWLLVILWMTLLPIPGLPLNPLRLCVICGHQGSGAGLLLNIVLYVPFGFFIYLKTGSARLALLGGLMLSFTIEAAQLRIPGRYSTAEDVLANSAGAWIGGVLAIRPLAWFAPTGRPAWLVSAAWACVATVVIALPGFAFAPSVPDDGTYFQWTPRIPTLERYRGRGVSAWIGDSEMTDGKVETAAAVRETLEAGGPIDVTFEAGPTPPHYAPLLEVVVGPYGEGEEAFQIGIDQNDLLVRFRYRADALRLDRPELRFTDVMSGYAPGERVTIAVAPLPDGATQVTLPGETLVAGLPAARGWALLLHPRSLPESAREWVDMAWVAGLLLLTGWWAPSLAATTLAALPVAALALVPIWSPLVSTPPATFLAGVVGLVVGFLARSLSRTRSSA